MKRRYTQGAEVGPEGTSFRVWAPACKTVELVTFGSTPLRQRMEPEADGYFSTVAHAPAGTLYKYALDGGDSFPDPASRFQPEGPHGPSQVIDPRAFQWTDAAWSARPFAEHVVYELHVGTFTHEGTWKSATAALDHLLDLGITLIEVMPIAEFPGRFGWGYDGVDLYAPCHVYGTPDDARRFVDRAHALGLAVILDVVYNHVGPNGNYLPRYTKTFFTKKHVTDWGDPVNYDDDGSHGVRRLVIDNAAYWIDELHFDGLRLDATQNIYDSSTPHVLAEISKAAHDAAPGRTVVVVAENEEQDARLAIAWEKGGFGIDGLWNDDFHHAAVVAMTGRREAYYTDYRGTPQELVSALKHGYLYQGQRYPWQKKRRGTPSATLPRSAFITYLENHDQVANSGDGTRLHTKVDPALWRAMTALTLLGPGTPMLFQGQELGSSAPFLFFAEHDDELNEKVRVGRAEFMAQFPSLASAEAKARMPNPSDTGTFLRCKLDLADRVKNHGSFDMHRSLIALRKGDRRFIEPDGFDGAILDTNAFCLRWLSAERGDLLAVMNLGPQLEVAHPSEPLLAPPNGTRWRVAWCSDDAAWGGEGTVAPENDDGEWTLAARSFTLLEAVRDDARKGSA